MKDTQVVTKDPICGMTVDERSALNVERDGKTFYFCGDRCRERFLSTAGASSEEKESGSCCG